METRRWTNPSQPQTLYIAVVLLYINAVFMVLFGGLLNPIALLLAAGYVGAGFGIANERKWGYRLGVGVAALGLLPLIYVLATEGLGELFSVMFLINALFPIVLFALLVHPMSRDYQRVWFS